MSELVFRKASRADVPMIVAMLANDPLGRTRERADDPLPPSYYAAFEAIDANPRAQLIVVERNGKTVGTMQLDFVPCLTHQGGERMVIEAVHVLEGERGKGIGEAMMRWALARGRERGAHTAQLTSHKTRTRAHAFYQRLGFVASHTGFKRELAR
jgi:ribosomal protein S18 acetylase RimI-like enzyme